MMYLIGVLIMVFGIGISIALHEIGHLLPAKLFKVRTTQYMVGFGPTVWSRTRGETEYGVKAIPLGGYVRMVGMFPPRADGTLRSTSSNPFHQMIEQARADSLEEVGPGDEDRVFYKLPVWKRLIVMGGGPAMNALLAVLLLIPLVTMQGFADLTNQVKTVSQCAVVTTPQDTEPVTDCTGHPDSPALAAGFQPGDRILSVNGAEVSDWVSTTYAIQNAGDHATFVIDRAGQQQTLNADLVLRERPLMTAEGMPLLDEAGEAVWGEVGFLGISPALDYFPQPITEVPPMASDLFTRTAGIIFTLPQRMVDIAEAAFGSAERDQDGPISVVGVGRVAGEVADGRVFFAEDIVDRFWVLISLLASLNMALFVFNLIPLLPLDGGHIAGALWDGAKRTWARVRKLPMPGPVDTAKGLPIAYVVALSFLAMSALLIYADIVKPIRIG